MDGLNVTSRQGWCLTKMSHDDSAESPESPTATTRGSVARGTISDNLANALETLFNKRKTASSDTVIQRLNAALGNAFGAALTAIPATMTHALLAPFSVSSVATATTTTTTTDAAEVTEERTKRLFQWTAKASIWFFDANDKRAEIPSRCGLNWETDSPALSQFLFKRALDTVSLRGSLRSFIDTTCGPGCTYMLFPEFLMLGACIENSIRISRQMLLEDAMREAVSTHTHYFHGAAHHTSWCAAFVEDVTSTFRSKITTVLGSRSAAKGLGAVRPDFVSALVAGPFGARHSVDYLETRPLAAFQELAKESRGILSWLAASNVLPVASYGPIDAVVLAQFAENADPFCSSEVFPAVVTRLSKLFFCHYSGKHQRQSEYVAGVPPMAFLSSKLVAAVGISTTDDAVVVFLQLSHVTQAIPRARSGVTVSELLIFRRLFIAHMRACGLLVAAGDHLTSSTQLTAAIRGQLDNEAPLRLLSNNPAAFRVRLGEHLAARARSNPSWWTVAEVVSSCMQLLAPAAALGRGMHAHCAVDDDVSAASLAIELHAAVFPSVAWTSLTDTSVDLLVSYLNPFVGALLQRRASPSLPRYFPLADVVAVAFAQEEGHSGGPVDATDLAAADVPLWIFACLRGNLRRHSVRFIKQVSEQDGARRGPAGGVCLSEAIVAYCQFRRITDEWHESFVRACAVVAHALSDDLSDSIRSAQGTLPMFVKKRFADEWCVLLCGPPSAGGRPMRKEVADELLQAAEKLLSVAQQLLQPNRRTTVRFLDHEGFQRAYSWWRAAGAGGSLSAYEIAVQHGDLRGQRRDVRSVLRVQFPDVAPDEHVQDVPEERRTSLRLSPLRFVLAAAEVFPLLDQGVALAGGEGVMSSSVPYLSARGVANVIWTASNASDLIKHTRTALTSLLGRRGWRELEVANDWMLRLRALTSIADALVVDHYLAQLSRLDGAFSAVSGQDTRVSAVKGLVRNLPRSVLLDLLYWAEHDDHRSDVAGHFGTLPTLGGVQDLTRFLSEVWAMVLDEAVSSACRCIVLHDALMAFFIFDRLPCPLPFSGCHDVDERSPWLTLDACAAQFQSWLDELSGGGVAVDVAARDVVPLLRAQLVESERLFPCAVQLHLTGWRHHFADPGRFLEGACVPVGILRSAMLVVERYLPLNGPVTLPSLVGRLLAMTGNHTRRTVEQPQTRDGESGDDAQQDVDEVDIDQRRFQASVWDFVKYFFADFSHRHETTLPLARVLRCFSFFFLAVGRHYLEREDENDPGFPSSGRVSADELCGLVADVHLFQDEACFLSCLLPLSESADDESRVKGRPAELPGVRASAAHLAWDASNVLARSALLYDTFHTEKFGRSLFLDA
mgnify:CR=1 FL=1